MTFPADSAENVTYTYDQSGHGDGIGRLTSVTDAAGTLSRSYDQFGNLLTDVRTTSTANLTTAYTYDAAHRIASITYPSGAVVSYTHDTMGRVTAVSAQPPGGSSAPVASNIAYEPFGPSTTLTYGNGVAESRGFDQDYRMTGITDTGTSALQALTYAYYPTDDVQKITDVNSGNSQSFGYDNMQRLNQATGGYGSYGFTYDKDGNRLSQTLGVVTTNYGYGTANDLLATESVGGTVTQTIGYTADGRMASFSPGIQAPGGQYITSLSYNQDARLSAVNSTGGALASYTYDGFGQRSIKTISAGSGDIYQYSQDGLLFEETNASGVAQADYIYLDGRPIATVNPSTGNLYFLHDDMLGTPQLATDGDKAVAWQANYQPFGTTSSVSGTITQNLRLPGQYFDVESGWSHNGFRNFIPDLGRYAEPDPLALQGTAQFYDPATGKMTHEDPMEFAESDTTPFAYADDNPVDLSDPTGLTTYACTAPLHAPGKLIGRALYYSPLGWLGSPLNLGAEHEYLCTVNGKTTICGGQDRDGPKGVPSHDTMGERGGSCRKQSDKQCVDKCVDDAIKNPNRPGYNVLNVGGANCQKWAEDLLNKCKRQCGGF